MRFAVIGSGAVGSYFGAKLQQANHEVVFVARGGQLRALRERGLTLQQENAEVTLRPVAVTDDITSIGPVDYVLICVKTWQIREIAPALPSLKGNQTRFLTLQNGVEAPQEVAQCVGAAHILGGLVRGFFQMEAPGKVRHVGVQPAIIFGQIEGASTPEARQLLDCLLGADIHAELSEAIDIPLWEKFLLVTSLSGVGAVTRSPIGNIRAYAPTWQLLQDVMQEIVTVAKGRGIPLPDDTIDRTLAFVRTFPPEATTSMQRDIMNGLPSELDAQTGAVVRLGEAAGITTPINRLIYDCLILQERGARQNQDRT